MMPMMDLSLLLQRRLRLKKHQRKKPLQLKLLLQKLMQFLSLKHLHQHQLLKRLLR